MSQADLAKAAELSRPRLTEIEGGSLPSLDTCLRLAAVLETPPGVIGLAQLRDAMADASPEAASDLDSAIGGSHWESVANHHGLRIESGRVLGSINADGDLSVVRRWSGCYATRPREFLTIRDRVVGDRPPVHAVKGAPRRLNYSIEVSEQGDWAVHQIRFARPWTPDDGPFDLEFETYIPQAFVFSREEERARRGGALDEWRGDYRTAVTYPFQHLEVAVELPEGYEPTWLEPTATWGTGQLSDTDKHSIPAESCRSANFDSAQQSARLILERPLPGYTFGIAWKPIEGWSSGKEE